MKFLRYLFHTSYYGGLHNYQVHIVSPLPTSDFPLPCSVRVAWPTASVPAPYKPKTLYLTEVQTAVLLAYQPQLYTFIYNNTALINQYF
ncbi:MAG: hypothetical protein F6J90_11645 [Moorea sp. SIOASIH]|uniref:hypothetical protein n=1 Tax=Moorena sp. SIOASIH TaxID=2607817 RepID=UPI0013B8D5FE|nr:hypothetical protein [Moorena sp. SIOASIH]NEO36926.1 hypothetical protein [Moorena sp. SIOASIH]